MLPSEMILCMYVCVCVRERITKEAHRKDKIDKEEEEEEEEGQFQQNVTF